MKASKGAVPVLLHLVEGSTSTGGSPHNFTNLVLKTESIGLIGIVGEPQKTLSFWEKTSCASEPRAAVHSPFRTVRGRCSSQVSTYPTTGRQNTTNVFMSKAAHDLASEKEREEGWRETTRSDKGQGEGRMAGQGEESLGCQRRRKVSEETK